MPTQMPPVVLSVAASDPLGGAGLQADVATLAALGVHPVTTVTVVTSQSLTEITSVLPMSPELVQSQIDGVLSEFTPKAVKTGMLYAPEVVEVIAALVTSGALPAPVVDPVMVNGTGKRFASQALEDTYRKQLFAVAEVITPNRAEAELLTGIELPTSNTVVANADALRALDAKAVVVTGGAFDGAPDDVIITANEVHVLPGERIETDNVRGSGCTFSAALASHLALGIDLINAAHKAHDFAHAAVSASANWQTSAPGPVSHTR